MLDPSTEYPFGAGLVEGDKGPLITLRTASYRYDVSLDTVYRWAADPALHFPELLEIKTRHFVYLVDLAAWEKQRPRAVPKSRAKRKQKMPNGARGKFVPRREAVL
jgi:hypothetical protein